MWMQFRESTPSQLQRERKRRKDIKDSLDRDEIIWCNIVVLVFTLLFFEREICVVEYNCKIPFSRTGDSHTVRLGIETSTNSEAIFDSTRTNFIMNEVDQSVLILFDGKLRRKKEIQLFSFIFPG